jgi:hypothetical protein
MSPGLERVLEERNQVPATDKLVLLNGSDSRAGKSGVSESRIPMYLSVGIGI